MNEGLINFFQNVLNAWSHTGIYYAAMALFFVVVSRGRECNRGMQYWQKNNVLVDLCYWFVVPVFGKYVKLALLVLGAEYLLGLSTTAEQNDYFENGFGILSTLPLWSQVLLILLLSDIILYWMHRYFHGRRLWKIHAVHHSTKELDWPSAARFHPFNVWATFLLVDVFMMFLGFAPAAFVLLAPFNVLYSGFVHANLNWKMGWLGYVLASPVFHRWHHTAANEGGNKNFAPTFPVLDMIFGTYYMPKDRLPETYGIDDHDFPMHHFVDQLFYPFRK